MMKIPETFRWTLPLTALLLTAACGKSGAQDEGDNDGGDTSEDGVDEEDGSTGEGEGDTGSDGEGEGEGSGDGDGSGDDSGSDGSTGDDSGDTGSGSDGGTDSGDSGSDGGGPCSSNDECDNDLWCDGAETCDPIKGCIPGTPPVDCDDGISCTEDRCDEITRGCVAVEDHAACGDTNICDGGDACDPSHQDADPKTGCVTDLPPPECDDGVACTVDSCDPAIGCVNRPDHSVCECGQTCDEEMGCGDYCVPTDCGGKTWQCGDCIDNDGDCKIDALDADCWGPCDNNEAGFKGDIPGQNNAPCKMDCYFDDNSGSGNDQCYWDHGCDPNSPQGEDCPYDENTTISGFDGTCADAFEMQSQVCEATCGPLVPNGCDCFGCCEVYFDGEDEPVTVYLGTTDENGDGSCSADLAADPAQCAPCLQVEACLNTCERCEVCIGKPEPPDDCDPDDTCEDSGLTPCDPSGFCPAGFSCVTGCCVPNPQ